MIVVFFTLCNSELLTFAILPTSFPHSPPHFVLLISPYPCKAFPLTGFWCWPGLFFMLIDGALASFPLCTRVDCSNSKSRIIFVDLFNSHIGALFLREPTRQCIYGSRLQA